ncbi:heat shock protein transcriptional repressor HspR [Nocardioides sp. GXZ039]|uniref:heat shock protein transcriptional repressor HspR n=1 Tax=Nocardioides sp. GXZ039 TaxID=3136018 RepID=UPI0030F4ADCE
MSERSLTPPPYDAPVYVISVAAQLTGLHPQTLRTYERLGLITPGRTVGGGRRYSHQDLELLRTIADLTSAGIGIEGVRRILELEQRVAALTATNEELTAELEEARGVPSASRARGRAGGAADRLPVVRAPSPTQSVVVWRRGQR